MNTVMKHFLLSLLTATLMVFSFSASAESTWVGALAPDFKLQDQNEEWKSLEDYKGQWLVLYFYPKDDTPGCTTEAKNFRDGYKDIKALNADVVGVSLDDVESHKSFAEIHGLPFSILADVDKEAATAYDVLGGFGPVEYAKRQTFIIDPDGNIVYHYDDVDPDTHMTNVVAQLKSLQKDS